MRSRSLFRLLPLLLLALGGAREAAAQACLSTQGSNEYCKALTPAVRFGFPRYATAALPTCNTNNKGAVAYDTTTDTVKYCTGSAWSAVGSTFTGGTITSPILAPDGSVSAPVLARSAQTNTGLYWLSNALVYGALGEGRFAFDSDTLLSCPTCPLAWRSGAGLSGSTDLYVYRDAANTLAQRNGTNANTLSVYTTYTDASNYVRTDIGRSPYFGSSQGITVDGQGTGANPDFLIGTRGAGYISFAPNGSSVLRISSTNGLELAASGTGILTSATMNAENYGLYRGVTQSFAWTNAMVVALGATTAGDITVATLPAKTQVLDAAVVITGTAAGVTTLTVSCGDAVGGTPFTNYILPSDAKVAANTFYGDANSERGASLDGDPLVYLPSYTATTLVTCHFISTGANLDQVTGSTGRVILTTRLLP